MPKEQTDLLLHGPETKGIFCKFREKGGEEIKSGFKILCTEEVKRC